MTSSSLMHEAGHSKLVLWDNPEGWGGRKVGGEFRMGGHMYTCGSVLHSIPSSGLVHTLFLFLLSLGPRELPFLLGKGQMLLVLFLWADYPKQIRMLLQVTPTQQSVQEKPQRASWTVRTLGKG